jgi:formylglycine-generating enzyme required for sulfatase activity
MLAADDPYVQTLKKLDFTIQQIKGITVITPPLCFIEAGHFVMGSDTTKDPDAFLTETPAHPVYTSEYAIATFPVTVGEFECFVNNGGTRPEARRHVSWDTQLQHRDHPVVCVRWIDAIAYIGWLRKLTGQPWRLPTEAEWEKAARWNVSNKNKEGPRYPWGHRFDKRRCNTNSSRIGTTTPIDCYPNGISPNGVWDMAGNVWEWTSSQFKSYPYNPNDGREDLTSRKHRVLRGGAWFLDSTVARTTCRNKENPVTFAGYFYDVGFRLVQEKPSARREE